MRTREGGQRCGRGSPALGSGGRNRGGGGVLEIGAVLADYGRGKPWAVCLASAIAYVPASFYRVEAGRRHPTLQQVMPVWSSPPLSSREIDI